MNRTRRQHSSQPARGTRATPKPASQPSSQRTAIDEEIVHDLVFYVLQHLNERLLTRRTLEKVCKTITGAKKIAVNIDAANERLKEVYGYELEVVDEKSFTIRRLTPNLAYKPSGDAGQETEEEEEVEDPQHLATFLIMSLAFNSRGSLTSVGVKDFFTAMDMHDINTEALLSKLVAEKMLEHRENKYSFGPTAEVHVKKLDLLKFLARVHNRRVELWGRLYLEAVEQERVHRMRNVEINGEETTEEDVEEI